MTQVLAPLGGRVIALADVPDPVFAGLVVGAGLAIEPEEGASEVLVVSPVAGRVMKVHPHAFVVLDKAGAGVLVHLGIDTVKLDGQGFTVHVADGDEVERGARMITWDPGAVRRAGYSAVCPVVVMQSKPDDVEPAAAIGSPIALGSPLFSWSPAAVS